jgi:hypothetical protein
MSAAAKRILWRGSLETGRDSFGWQSAGEIWDEQSSMMMMRRLSAVLPWLSMLLLLLVFWDRSLLVRLADVVVFRGIDIGVSSSGPDYRDTCGIGDTERL